MKAEEVFRMTIFGMLEIKCGILWPAGLIDAAERQGILQLKEKRRQLKLAKGRK